MLCRASSTMLMLKQWRAVNEEIVRHHRQRLGARARVVRKGAANQLNGAKVTDARNGTVAYSSANYFDVTALQFDSLIDY
jgi:hypothetical protein